MKRLLWYLNQITDNGTTTYRYTAYDEGRPVQKEIYDGECEVKVSGHFGVRREPTYWQNDISYMFERTNKLTLDRPTVTISIPVEKVGIAVFTPAAADFCLREIAPYFDAVNAEYVNKARPDTDNGQFYVYRPGGEVLLRNTAYFTMRPQKDYENLRGAQIYERESFKEPLPDRMSLCIRIEIQLPHGKLKRAKKMLISDLPDVAERFVREFDSARFAAALELEAKQNDIRRFLRKNGYCAFIANGSILPREKNTELPMKNALPFKSTPGDEIEVAGVRGMGIRRGVTVITGGGYSGKSTLLNAVSAGIYNHTTCDGRELCISDDTAVTITAEDGRAISALNISPFIKWLPRGDTRGFSTEHASGSTSQAANIIEAIDCGSTLLLIDEDRSATNFMIRDALMKELIKKEPITPFTDRVREIAANGVSTILVIGGSGEYLSVADKVYMMEDFVIGDVTERVKTIAPEQSDLPPDADWLTNRAMLADGFTSYPEGGSKERLEVTDTGFIIIGDEKIDLRALHDVKTAAQVNALAFMLLYLERGTDTGDEMEALARSMRGFERSHPDGEIEIASMVHKLYTQIAEEGLNVIDTGFFTTINRFLDLPRKFELRAAINRMRRVKWTKL
ncbi:hypothetical protein FACS1894105_08470 [Clostridia bacterium]|nr:hypothetical protein FACS1894105_08470 [Clostridia bacterium]